MFVRVGEEFFCFHFLTLLRRVKILEIPIKKVATDGYVIRGRFETRSIKLIGAVLLRSVK